MRLRVLRCVCVGIVGDIVIFIGHAEGRLRISGVKRVFACLLVTCPSVACTCLAQNVPSTTAKALDGSTLSFPRAQSQKPLVVMVGFSRKSSGDFQQWNQRALSPYLTDPRIDYYELPELQGAPSFVRPMILHGMRRDVPAAEHSHFAPLTTGEEEWKKTVGYSASKDTYLILAEPSGHVVWQTSGAPDDAKVAAFKQALARLTHSAQP
jgi:hypothetical protein